MARPNAWIAAFLLFAACIDGLEGKVSPPPPLPIDGTWRYTLLAECAGDGTAACTTSVWGICAGGTLQDFFVFGMEHPALKYEGDALCGRVEYLIQGSIHEGWFSATFGDGWIEGNYDQEFLRGATSDATKPRVVFRANRLRGEEGAGVLEIPVTLNGAPVIDADPLRAACEFLGADPLLMLDGLGPVFAPGHASGRIVVERAEPGPHRVTARCGVCRSTTLVEATTEAVVPRSGTTTAAPLVFTGVGADASITARWDPGACPAEPDVNVTVAVEGASCRETRVSCVGGNATISRLRPGTYRVSVRAFYGPLLLNHCGGSANASVAPGATVDASVWFSPCDPSLL